MYKRQNKDVSEENIYAPQIVNMTLSAKKSSDMHTFVKKEPFGPQLCC